MRFEFTLHNRQEHHLNFWRGIRSQLKWGLNLQSNWVEDIAGVERTLGNPGSPRWKLTPDNFQCFELENLRHLSFFQILSQFRYPYTTFGLCKVNARYLNFRTTHNKVVVLFFVLRFSAYEISVTFLKKKLASKYVTLSSISLLSGSDYVKPWWFATE